MNKRRGTDRAHSISKISLITIFGGFTIIGISFLVLHLQGYSNPQIAQEVHDELKPAPGFFAPPVKIVAGPMKPVVIKKPEPAPQPAKPSLTTFESGRYGDDRDDIIDQMNVQRVEQGLNVFKRNTLLDAAAQAKADAMVRQDFFSHTDPDGSAPWHYFVEAGYTYKYAGENLYKDFTPTARPEYAISEWIASPTHFANIIKPQYTETGLAIEGPYIVQEFGQPAY